MLEKKIKNHHFEKDVLQMNDNDHDDHDDNDDHDQHFCVAHSAGDVLRLHLSHLRQRFG